jgi:hypothetical protein
MFAVIIFVMEVVKHLYTINKHLFFYFFVSVQKNSPLQMIFIHTQG